MADYSMGQYRFNGKSTLTNLTPSIAYEDINISSDNSSDESANNSQKDVVISRADGKEFDVNKDYYASISIPQDMNYDLELTIKLTKADKENETYNYQYLRTVTIPRGGSGFNTATVVLYETNEIETPEVVDNDGNIVSETTYKIKAMIPEDIPDGIIDESIGYNKSEIKANDSIKENYLYQRKQYASADGSQAVIGIYYYLGTKKDDGTFWLVRTDKYNDIIMTASWRENDGDSFSNISFIFRPVESGFSKIKLQMTRGAEDYNIERTYKKDDGTIETEYGRKIDITKMSGKCTIGEIRNLLSSDIPHTLSKIGVWGHPELMMAINGEEIKIGPSGYYELDTISIKTLGIVASDYKDTFSIDYQYIIS